MLYRLSSYHNGLGDCLQFSTLPAMLSLADHEVHLLDDPYHEQVQPYRNHEIKDFVWGTNPYLKEPIQGIWNAGDTPFIKYENKTGNFIKNWELAHGFEPINSFPIIYERLDLTMTGTPPALIELSSISLKYDEEKVHSTVQSLINKYKHRYRFWELESKHQSQKIEIQNIPGHVSNSLKETHQILCRTNCFISLSNGVHSLAAAARRHNPFLNQWCILPDHHWDFAIESRLFVYPDIKYIKEGETDLNNYFMYEQ